jgi:hypothetical protein
VPEEWGDDVGVDRGAAVCSFYIAMGFVLVKLRAIGRVKGIYPKPRAARRTVP